ncbi:MAG: hypothetical protein WKF77_06030 [Planctomycetaceae bacterium]
MSRVLRSLRWIVLCSVVVGLGWAAIRNQDRLKSLLRPAAPTASAEKVSPPPIQEPKVLKLSPQARQNLKLFSKPVKPQSFWRKILVPGEVVDRPGLSDRGVTSPAVGVVTQVHAFPGDTVRPGERLFTLRLISEYLQNTQSELFRAVRETELINEQLERLRPLAATGGLSQAKLIELEQQLKRQQAAIDGYRQDLLTRGLNPEQIGEIQEGRFVASIDVVAPPALSVQSLTQTQSSPPKTSDETASLNEDAPDSIAYEVQDLQVDLGTRCRRGSCFLSSRIMVRSTSQGMLSNEKPRIWSRLLSRGGRLKWSLPKMMHPTGRRLIRHFGSGIFRIPLTRPVALSTSSLH